MEIYERIKELRKNHLKMSQEVFAEHLGVSRSVIKNIELNALARPDQKLSLYKLICSEFNVSEDWLLHGVGSMYANKETEYSTLIDQIMNGENEFAKNVFKTFAQFDEKDWEALQHIIEKFEEVSEESSDDHYDVFPESTIDISAIIDSIAKEEEEEARAQLFPLKKKSVKKKA